MTVRVLFFAMLRETMGKSEDEVTVTSGETVEMFTKRILGEAQQSHFLFAVNQCYVTADYLVKDGDEIACIPPLAGG